MRLIGGSIKYRMLSHELVIILVFTLFSSCYDIGFRFVRVNKNDVRYFVLLTLDSSKENKISLSDVIVFHVGFESTKELIKFLQVEIFYFRKEKESRENGGYVN